MTKLHTLHGFLGGALAAAAILGLSACAGGEGDDEATTVVVTATADPDAPAGAFADLSNVTCATDEAGVWSITATVTNAEDADQHYVVTAAVGLIDGGTVQGAIDIEQDVAAGESAEVAAEAFHTSEGEQPLQCVVSAVKSPAE